MKNQSIWKKLKFAFNGIVYATKNEHNMQRHLISALIVICLFSYFKISIFWWALIILCIGLIIASELLNSAIEALIDYLHPELHEKIGKIKDMLAGMVLILSITAAIIGFLAILSVLST
ncbi:diacylglycerol kinase [Aliarcobacter cibarius]|uniref:Diacylglycerol kinase n=1 Tax=Aliarcobacter cibarius TaxID=255507 RepID=A0A7L5JNZ2_9BACT|nr:diacylglycerol kinase [Aliarcobacter cibarius]QKJ26870.1 diacylglycerol kinase [Aliarcobacter cibarius]